ncbi:MAG: peptidoglycan -binding protein [Sphingomonadales bacterium]
MAARLARRGPQAGTDLSWPGFVDALSSLLLVVIFVLLIFFLSQTFLSIALSGRDEALAALRSDLNDLARQLRMERATSLELRDEISVLSATLSTAQQDNEALRTQITGLTGQLNEARANLVQAAEDQAAAQARIAALTVDVEERDKRLAAEEARTSAARDEIALLNQNLAALRQQIASLEQKLDASEQKDKRQEAIIKNLGERLNAALANKVAELSDYRSEFFGRLKALLGARPDIIVEGDRFVFQSELLFGSGSADLGEAGKRQLATIAETLLIIGDTIPQEVDWVLRVDGHTDILPIRTEQFPSNWELSQARALSVVKFLISQGVPPSRLAAAGFGPYQPRDPRNTAAAYRTNRRIELRLDQS